MTNKYDAESFSAKLQCAAPDSIMGKISFSDSPVLELLILSGLKRTLEHKHSKDKGFICRRCKWMTHFTERAEALLDIGIDNPTDLWPRSILTHSNFETENNAGASECQKILTGTS